MRGSRFGTYEVLDPLGAGGMGEVFRARDSRLGRDVALKVLSEPFKLDAQRRARFEREARVLASLNHPNIATLYGIEELGDTQALVLELVEGETLAERIAGGPIPWAEALTIARQIAAALDAAHEQGVVHRDLKPANVKLRPDGTVKLLDFGLARTFNPTLGDSGPKQATVTAVGGTVLGTPAYMSPEQARGEAAGHQADIWSFGVLLYELLTAVSPFRRQTTTETLAAVLGAQPDLALLPREAPAIAQQLIRRCLERDPRKRLHHIADARIEVEEALAEPPPGASPSPRDATTTRSRDHWIWATALLGFAAIALLAANVYRRESPDLAGPVRFSIFPPAPGMFLTPLTTGSNAPVGGAISPDGRTLAYTATDASGTTVLWVRPLDSLEARALPDTQHAALPFWSPDGKSLGFFGHGKLKRVDIADGAVQVLCDVVRGRGGSWNRDGVIIFAPALGGALRRVSAAGGEPQALTALREGQRSHRFPSFLPDGRHFLYYVEDSQAPRSGVFVGELGANTDRRLIAADSAAVYAPPGHLLFARQGTLFAQRFDAATLEVAGDPVSLATSIPTEGTSPAFSVSGTGILTYRSEPPQSQQFAWFDRAGRLLETVGEPGNYRGVDLSPDGQRIAVHRHDGDGGDIWVFEAGGTTTRVTFDPAQDNSSPIWSPDSARIVFGSFRNGKWGLYQKRVNGTDAGELLTESDAPKIPAAWSPDGKSIVYWLYRNGIDSWLLPLTEDFQLERGVRGNLDGEPKGIPLISTPFYEGHAQVSPDGKWIAYVSSDNGSTQVYVRPFPSGDGVWPVSSNRGVTPRWRADSKELFYVTSYDNGKLMAVSVREEDGQFKSGTPQDLFSVEMVTPPHSTTINTYHTYDVSPDGQRFLIPRPASTLRDDATPTPITVVLNWHALLER